MPLIFFTAVCNLVYELSLAQLASSLLGGTLYRYALYIGVYICMMGIGSLAFNLINREKKIITFIVLEFILISLVSILPIQLIYLNNLLNVSKLEIIIYLNTTIIGLISGIELPLLLSIFKLSDESNQFLFIDYIGMFFGSAIFAVLLFPYFGIFSSIWTASIINMSILLYFIIINTLENKLKYIMFIGVLLMFCININLINNSELYLEKLQNEYIK